LGKSKGGATALHGLFEKLVLGLQLALHFLHRVSHYSRAHGYHHDDLPGIAKETPIGSNFATHPARQGNRSQRARETGSGQNGKIHHPVLGEWTIAVETRREILEEIHQVPDREDANRHKQDRSTRRQDPEQSGDQHTGKNHTLFYFEKLAQAGEPDGLPGICVQRQAGLQETAP